MALASGSALLDLGLDLDLVVHVCTVYQLRCLVVSLTSDTGSASVGSVAVLFARARCQGNWQVPKLVNSTHVDLEVDLLACVDLACEQRILAGSCAADADASLSASLVPTLASDDPCPQREQTA
jgi:hypothetical protein